MPLPLEPVKPLWFPLRVIVLELPSVNEPAPVIVSAAASQSICPEFSQFEYLAGGASGKGAVTKVDCEATRELAGGAPPPAR